MGRRALTVLSTALALSISAAAFAMPPTATGLSSGHHGSYSWAVALEPRGGRTSSNHGRASAPCLRVAITIRHGRHAYGRSIFRDCGIPPAGPRRGGPPLVAGGSQLGRTERAGMTVIGIVSTAPAREVRLVFSDGTEAASPLRDLTSAVFSAAGQGRIRYAVLTLPGDHCIERLVTLSAGGRALWEGAPAGHSCSS